MLLFRNYNLSRTVLFTVLFSVLYSLSALAQTHQIPVNSNFIGATLGYTHLNDREYRIELTQYNSCSKAKLDSSQECFIVEKNSGGLYKKIKLELTSFADTAISLAVSCEGNRDNCLKKVKYTKIISLPTMYGGYEVLWLSNEISEELINYSMTTEQNSVLLKATIPYLNKDVYNSSPIFTSVPFKKTCVNKTLDYYLQSKDTDADSLVYSITEPFAGKKNSNMPNMIATSAGSMHSPAPPLPPPNGSVDYPRYPHHHFESKQLNIDPAKEPRPVISKGEGPIGSWRFNPNQKGKYLATISVSEYRNKKLLSETQILFIFSAEQ